MAERCQVRFWNPQLKHMEQCDKEQGHWKGTPFDLLEKYKADKFDALSGRRGGGHDPINDEKLPLSIDQFYNRVQVDFEDWHKSFRDQNEFTRGSHTYNEWMMHFLRFMSW